MQSRLIPSLSFTSAKEAPRILSRGLRCTRCLSLQSQCRTGQPGLPDDADLEAMAIHVGFSVLETSLQCADAFRGTPIPSNQVDLILDVNAADATSAAAANAFYQCVVASQTVIMEIPFERQFWGGKMGHFTDRYGISWILHVMSWRQIKDPTAQ